MLEVKVNVPDYEIKGKHITKFEVSTLNFLKFAAIGSAASSMESTPHAVAKRMFRERIKAQVRAINGDGSSVVLDEQAVAQIPVSCAMSIKNAMNVVLLQDKPEEPMLLSGKDADGITTAIHIRLGTPIRYKEGAETKEIWELEFQAKTLSDIEDVIIADNKIDQATALLAIAKPIGPDVKLISLPSWAVEQITMSDGLWIMTNAMSPFLDMDETL